MTWTLLSSHGRVLVCLHAHGDGPSLRELAAATGLTERSVLKIVSDLVEEGYVSRERVGRNSHYTLHLERRVRDPQLANHSIGDLISGLRPRSHPSRGDDER